MRKGAPFHGAKGEGKTATSAASSQEPDELWAWAFPNGKAKNAPAISNNAAAVNRRIGII
jgi:hypothetical protein